MLQIENRWGEAMIPRVMEVKHAGEYRLWLRFQDGVSGVVDLTAQLWGPIFEPLKDVELFAQAAVDFASDTVVWPNGADLAPEFLYEAAKQSGEATALR